MVINGDKEKFFQVRAQLPPQEKEELMLFLRRNIDVFSWSLFFSMLVSFFFSSIIIFVFI